MGAAVVDPRDELPAPGWRPRRVTTSSRHSACASGVSASCSRSVAPAAPVLPRYTSRPPPGVSPCGRSPSATANWYIASWAWRCASSLVTGLLPVLMSTTTNRPAPSRSSRSTLPRTRTPGPPPSVADDAVDVDLGADLGELTAGLCPPLREGRQHRAVPGEFVVANTTRDSNGSLSQTFSSSLSIWLSVLPDSATSACSSDPTADRTSRPSVPPWRSSSQRSGQSLQHLQGRRRQRDGVVVPAPQRFLAGQRRHPVPLRRIGAGHPCRASRANWLLPGDERAGRLPHRKLLCRRRMRAAERPAPRPLSKRKSA